MKDEGGGPNNCKCNDDAARWEMGDKANHGLVTGVRKTVVQPMVPNQELPPFKLLTATRLLMSPLPPPNLRGLTFQSSSSQIRISHHEAKRGGPVRIQRRSRDGADAVT